MGRRLWVLVAVALMFSLSMVNSVVANDDEVFQPGFVEWEINSHERLYVEGANPDEAVLQRGQTDSAVGGFSTGVTTDPIPVFTVQSPPVEEAIQADVMMGVYFSVILDGGGGPQACTRQLPLPGDESTTLFYSVSANGSEIYSDEISQVVDKVAENDAMNFSGEMKNVTLNLSPGDSLTLSLDIHHQCAGTQARVQWGGFEYNSGGIIMEGVLYEPEARILVDASRRAHVELSHNLPWGLADLRDEKWEIWGPLDERQKSTRDGELLVETSAGRIRMVRDLGGNDSVYSWSGAEKLPIGDLNLQFCLRTIAGDLNSDCHAEGILRFEVDEGDTGFASAGLYLTITTFLALAGYIFNAFRNGLMLPLPILGALLALAILTLPTIFDIPNLGADAVIQPTTKVIDSPLVNLAGEEVTLSELVEGHEAVIIGIVLPGSENGLTQSTQLNKSIDQLGERVTVIQLVTGTDARMSDVASLASQVNSTWEVYLDKDAQFAQSLPTGRSDAIVIVDPAMHVTFSQPSSAAMLDIVEAVDEIASGGPKSAITYFGLIVGPGMFLLFLALPREEWTVPEEPLPPGLLWASIILASGAGILMINLPALLLALLPVGMTIRFALDIVMMLWMIEMCFFTAKRGSPYEADALGKLMHSLFPKAFQNWRDPVDMDRDVLLGVWLGWFGWLSFPSLFPQGIGATALTGMSGAFMAVMLLLLFVLTGGFVVLLLRIVSSWGGPFSRLFGKFGGEVFAQFVGWVLLPVAMWVGLNTALNAFELGIF
ncbi:MAG: hypothetical protein CMA10_07780 [Euryarchaeota archaeon]|nr:hypothetical protein [Euryarchaeota archaeon]